MAKRKITAYMRIRKVQTMTSRERNAATLKHQQTDKLAVPFNTPCGPRGTMPAVCELNITKAAYETEP